MHFPPNQHHGLAQVQRIHNLSEQLAKATHFSLDECEALIFLHHRLESVGPLDRLRMREVLHIIFEITDDVMLDLAFKAFDRDGDYRISEVEFVKGISTMLRGTTEELGDWCYFIYDINGDGGLAREELAHCLKGCLVPGFGIDDDETEEGEREIVEIVMKKLDVDRDGQITLPDFKRAIRRDPLLLVSVGPCLPPARCCAAFLSLITDRFRSYTGALGRHAIKKQQSNKKRSYSGTVSTHTLESVSSFNLQQGYRKPSILPHDDEEGRHLREIARAASKKRTRPQSSDEDSDSDHESSSTKKNQPLKKQKTSTTQSSSQNSSHKKEENDQDVWKWWEEGPRKDDDVKWKFLEHNGPVFAPPYERLPEKVKFRYDGRAVGLSQDAEEIAGFYSRFIEHDYATKEEFNINFFKDWRNSMTPKERNLITNLKKCDFRDINEYYKQKSEERKAMSKSDKLKVKEENEALVKKYGIAIIDQHKEKIGNFKIEPPGLFRGRGEHPKMGMLKRRVMPEDVIINCSKDSKCPRAPAGHKWKEIRHDNTVAWLACWTENVLGQPKYVMLNPTSRVKGEKDWKKYEKARELADNIDEIRENYHEDFKSKDMRTRQRAVAMYFIDKFALRAGNEKDDGQADTVGCCSLRYEHIQLAEKNMVIFDFLGKDSIRYYNEVPVEKLVYTNLETFMKNKTDGDDLFDQLTTTTLNKHLHELMPGLTAKVFRTYNASFTLQQQLDQLTPDDGTVAEKILAYNRANRAVAILCNHQRAVPKTHEKSMENLGNKINDKKNEIKDVKKVLRNLKRGTKDFDKKTAQVERLTQQLERFELSLTDKEEGKDIALGTSKLNYLDPRITVAWCKKYDVPIEKVYNKSQRDKFRWAIDMATSDYRFD